ncbi:MAG TPA: helix-turn-helix domain-containing protein [Chitinophaga sp.]
MKILARHLNSFIAFARVRNIPVAAITEVMEHPPADWQDETATVEVADFRKVVSFIYNILKDELLGIHVGNFVHLQHLGAIYQISVKSTSVEEALFYCRTYLERTHPLVHVRMSTTDSITTIDLSIDDDLTPVHRIILEHMATLIAREIKAISGEDVDLVVTSPFYSPEHPASWKKGPRFTVVFAGAVLKAGLKDNSHWGFDILIPAYLSLMEGLDPDTSFGNKVKLTALNMANPCLPDLPMIADAFNITPRTLQRRLAEEGTTYRRISEDLKRKICDLLIRHDRYAILDISHILGYSEPAAFIHSFKKWHGVPPRKHVI